MDEPAIPIIQIRPGCLLLYNLSFRNYLGATSCRLDRNATAAPHKLYTGKMNSKSKSKLRFSINLLVAQAREKEQFNHDTGKFYKFKVNFITLTLSAPQNDLSDRIIKSKMLAPWIRNMRESFKLRSYVWRAERQKNGNIHFHFITDTYIRYDVIRDAWNYQQAKFHFITDFQQKNKSVFPNSTDVHAVFQIRNLASYMVKYMCKDEEGLDTIEGKVWDCSQNLKTKDRVSFELTISDNNLINSIKQHHPERLIETDHCTIVNLSDSEMKKCLPSKYYSEYRSWISSVYDNAVQDAVHIV